MTAAVKLQAKATEVAKDIFSDLRRLCAQAGLQFDRVFDDSDQTIIHAAITRAYAAGFDAGYREACDDADTALAMRVIRARPIRL